MSRQHAAIAPIVALILALPQLGPSAARAQTVVAKTPAPKVVNTASTVERVAFESGLTMGALGTPFIRRDLSWHSLPGASSYRVLRYQSSSTAPVAVTSATGTQYTAHILPGNAFVFRVVALSASGQPLDTTKAVSFATAAAPAQTQLTASGTRNNGTFTLGWNAIVNADDYSVTIALPPERLPHGGIGPADTLVNSTVTTTSFSSTMTGPSSHGYNIDIRANYTLHDYPTAGQVTRVPVESADMSGVSPFGTPPACQGAPPK